MKMIAVCSKCRSRNVERDREQEHPGVGVCHDCGHPYITDEEVPDESEMKHE
jgi:hypothetical protein